MTTTTSLASSPPSVVSPDRTIITPSPTSRRRGLSGLRRLGPPSPGEASRLSPRSYFSRSNYPRSPSSPPRSDRPQHPATNESAAPAIASRPSSDPSTQASTQSALSKTGSATSPAPLDRGAEPSDMARHRLSGSLRTAAAAAAAETAGGGESQRLTRVGEDASNDTGNATNSQTRGAAQDSPDEKPRPPTIRLFPHQELRQGRPSLTFAPIIRTLPSESSIVRVGRYSEREGIPISDPVGPSDAPVGFKSKVVSRKHCEFSFANGSWQIKDVSSSSGTFLNHIRLSQPNTESRLYPVKDGDIVQLGIDFRGGEEMIFRCVKIRIECNRSWQKRPNHFNMNRHAQLQKLGKGDAKVDEHKGECSICLGDVAPCQSLFIASCAHVWHYRCIRRMLMGSSSYPQFTCPNCRAVTDLEAELDVEDGEEWEENVEELVPQPGEVASTAIQPASPVQNQDDTVHVGGAAQAYHEAGGVDLSTINFASTAEQAATPPQTTTNSLLSRRQTSNSSMSSGIAPVSGIHIPSSSSATPLTPGVPHDATGTLRAATPTSADIIAGEGPLTPRNDAGPVVFDGSAGRSSGRRVTAMAMDESE